VVSCGVYFEIQQFILDYGPSESRLVVSYHGEARAFTPGNPNDERLGNDEIRASAELPLVD
jgi:hypothetical protein